MTRSVDEAEAIFLALADLNPAERDALLTSRCGTNARLRAEVEAMLAASDIPDDFLDPAQVPTLDPASIDGPLDPGARLGDYLVLHALGSGGMGVVYAAQQDRPHRTVAIKVLHRGARRREIMKRFELEAELLGRLQHPGIAQVFAFHAGDRVHPAYLVMELVPGPPITEYAQAHALPYMARVALAAQVCDAIQHAHDRGIVHRDLKPANVLMSDEGQPKILDFGIARATGLDLQLSTIQTLHGQLVGTLAYMSPEQLRGAADVDARSDVYGMGVLLYRLLAGRLPIDVANLPFAEALRRALEHEPTPLGLTDADLRGPLEQIVHRAMAPDRDRRYQSAAALATDLRAFVEGRPLSLAAVGEARPGLMRRQVRRYRRTAFSTTAAVLLLAAVTGYTLIERRRTDAVAARLQAELSANRIARGGLLAAAGSLAAAESILWPEYLLRADKTEARWALRDLYARQPVLWTAAADAGAVHIARFTPDDMHIVTGGDEGSLVVWNATTNRSERRIEAHEGGVRTIAIARGREWLVSGGVDGAVRAWRLADGSRVREISGHRGAVRSVTVTADSERLATCDESGVLRLWPSLDADRQLTFERSPALASVAHFAVDGRMLFAGWSDGLIEVRDAPTGRLARDVHAHDGAVTVIALSVDGRLIATAGRDRAVRVWDAAALTLVATLPSPSGAARAVAFRPDGLRLAVAGGRGIEIWDARTWQRLEPSLGRGQNWLDVAFSHSGDRLITADQGGIVRSWDARAEPVAESSRLPDGRFELTDIDGRTAVADIGEIDRRLRGNEPYQRSRVTRP